MSDENEMRGFGSGATRNVDKRKVDFEGHLNPMVLEVYGQYMHAARATKDGGYRDADNWQLGIPFAVYVKSLIRHTFDLWRMHRGYVVVNPDTGKLQTESDLCCAIIFNAMGYLKEHHDPSKINQPTEE